MYCIFSSKKGNMIYSFKNFILLLFYLYSQHIKIGLEFHQTSATCISNTKSILDGHYIHQTEPVKVLPTCFR